MSETGTLWMVDDQKELLDALSGVFSDAGFRFTGFEDPLELLAALESRPGPDLFVVDLNLPNLNGVQLIKRLRERPETESTPVVVVTAMSSESSVLNAFKAGANDVIRKPFGMSELLARITWQMTRRSELAALKRQNHDLHAMTQLAKTLSTGRALPYMLRDMIDVAKDTLELVRVSVYLVDPGSGDLHRALPSDPSRNEGSPNMTLSIRGFAKLSDTIAKREPALFGVEDTDKLFELMGGMPPTTSPDRSSAVFPMLDHDEFVGILVLISDSPKVCQSNREKSIANIVSDLAAIAVGSAQRETKVEVKEPPQTRSLSIGPTDELVSGIVESSPNAIVAADSSGKIVVFNKAAVNVLGWSRNEAIGADVRLLYPEGGAERIMHMLRSANFGGVGRLEPHPVVLLDRDKNEIPVEISAAIVRDIDGNEAATVGIFTDMRSRLQMEERLEEANQNLEESRRQVVAAELAGAAAHELNQPLTSLLGYAEMLRKKVGEESDLRRPVDKIWTEASRVADIVRKIGRITEYRTKEYVGGTRIVDLDQSSDVEDLTGLEDGVIEHAIEEEDPSLTAEYNRTKIPGVTDLDSKK